MNWNEYAKMATPAEIAYTMYKLQDIIDAQKELLELRERQFEKIRLHQECLECKLKNRSQEERDK